MANFFGRICNFSTPRHTGKEKHGKQEAGVILGFFEWGHSNFWKKLGLIGLKTSFFLSKFHF